MAVNREYDLLGYCFLLLRAGMSVEEAKIAFLQYIEVGPSL